jgi:hypothetical protein
MKQRFRIYFTLWLWILGGCGYFVLSPYSLKKVKDTSDFAIAGGLMLCPVYDLWRRFRRVTLHVSDGYLELRRGEDVVDQNPLNEVRTWGSVQNNNLAIRGVAMALVGLMGAFATSRDSGLTGGTALVLIVCVLLIAAAIYDWRMLQTLRMANERDITLTKAEVDELLGPPSYTVSSRAMHQSTGGR